jgi:hypothetical protein
VKIIRGRLDPADVSNPHIRYNSETDEIEITPDGGTTWNPAPGSDPRHALAFLKPPVAGSSKQCDAAANMVKWIKDFIDNLTALLATGATVTGIANAILLPVDLLFPGGDLLGLILEIADVIFGIGATALAAAFTSDQYDLLLCSFYCNAGIDGQVSADSLAEIKTEVTAELNTTAALVVNEILLLQGEIGLSNAGAIGSETGDCDGCDCGWCVEWPCDGGSLNGITLIEGTNEVDGLTGIYRDDNNQSTVDTRIPLGGTTPFRVTHLEMQYSADFTGGSGGAVIQGYAGGVKLFEADHGAAGTHVTWAWDGDETVEFIVYQIDSGSNATPAKIEHILWRGFGDAPALGTACP